MTSDERSPMRSLVASDLIWIVLGLTTTVASAYSLAFIHLKLRFSLFGYSAFGLLPVGALGCGIAAASGYFVAGRLLRRVPGALARTSMLLSGPLTFFLIYWFEYTQLEIDGRAISSILSFREFVTTVISETSVRLMPFDKELVVGKLGYGLAGMQAVAFWLAGLIPFFRSLATLHCDRCGRYLPDLVSTFGYGTSADLERAFRTAHGLASNGAIAAARIHVDSLARQELGHKLDLEVSECERCDRAYFRLRLLGWTKKLSWAVVEPHDVTAYVSVQRVR